jgi:folate-dependent phosphoribosylglycinamide formyltransferase PurN
VALYFNTSDLLLSSSPPSHVHREAKECSIKVVNIQHDNWMKRKNVSKLKEKLGMKMKAGYVDIYIYSGFMSFDL